MKIKSTIFTLIVLSLFLFASVAVTKEKEKDTRKSKAESVQKSESDAKSAKKEDSVVKKESPNTTVTSQKAQNKLLTTDEIIKKAGNPQATSSAVGEEINWQVISSGGNRGTSTNYILSGTVAQTAVGPGSSTNFNLHSGFWQNFSAATGCCTGIRGNVDGDGADAIDIADLVYFVAYSFAGGPAPICFEEADMDASLTLDIGDIVYLVAYSFSGGPAPLPC